MSKRVLLVAGIATLVGGCTMMPKYERPVAPISETWPSATNDGGTNAAADVSWRTFFEDPQLQRLIELALKNNRDLQVAALRVEQMRANYRIQRSQLFPRAQGGAGMVRQKTSGAVDSFNGGRELTSYTVDVTAGYELDLFGRIRSLKREALEQYLATDAVRRTVHISLISEIATEYIRLLQLQEAKRIAEQTLEAVQSSYSLNQRSFDAGAASELDLRTAEAQVQTAAVAVAGYAQLVEQSVNALVVLIGQPIPETMPPATPLREQHIVAELPVGLPSETLHRRPDIIAAEHTLKAANANIGAARAAFFPRITLTGSAGTASATLGDLFTGPSGTWSFAPQITIPLFDIGATGARRDVAIIAAQIEVANYEKAIQTAFREVADALAVRSMIDGQLRAQELLLSAQAKRFELTEARFRQGVDSYVDVLLAQQDLYLAQQNLLAIQSERLLNAVSLYRALGGGWATE